MMKRGITTKVDSLEVKSGDLEESYTLMEIYTRECGAKIYFKAREFKFG